MTNRGRFQAQGDDLEKSAPWATDNTIYKQTGIERIDNLQGQLTQNELNVRQTSIQKARNLVNQAPAEGYSAQLIKSFYDDVRQRSIRIDVEIRAGSAFLTPKDPNNG